MGVHVCVRVWGMGVLHEHVLRLSSSERILAGYIYMEFIIIPGLQMCLN